MAAKQIQHPNTSVINISELSIYQRKN